MSPFRAGLIAVVLVVVVSYFAYTQANPFADPYKFSATFDTINNLAPDAPVRIAGVEVGRVTEITPIPDADVGVARITMEMKEDGLPIHEDAELKIRPRIFLEGNEFVDLRPGTPSSPTLDDGGTIPVNQTATPVQFGQVLTALQSDTREDLRTFFEEYSLKALPGGGARNFNRSIEFWEPAYKSTALANDALLGTEEGDLGDVLRGQQKTFAALARSPDDLRGLVTNFNTTAAAFAREDDALQATIPALDDVLRVGRPALASLNDTFPGVRAFARDALPAVRSSGPTIEASFPFIRQARLLFSQAELRGLVDDLKPTIPALARLNARTIPLLNENRALSRCQNRVLLPFANDTDWEDAPPDEEQSGEPFKEQAPRSLVGLSGESRIVDGSSPLFRALFLGGTETVVNFSESEGTIFGSTALAPNAVQPPSPIKDDGRLDVPAHRPDVPCENQEPPDLHAPVGTVGAPGSGEDIIGDFVDPNLLPAKAAGAPELSKSDERQLERFAEKLAEDPGARRRLGDVLAGVGGPGSRRRLGELLGSGGIQGGGELGGDAKGQGGEKR